MAVRFPDPIHPVDPVELEINQLFDHLIMCLQQRRVALLTTYRDTRNEIADRPIDLAPKEEELIGLKTETHVVFRANCKHMEQVIAGMGQLVEEVVPVVPRCEEMRQIVAVGKEGKAPGELYYPNGVAIDVNTNQIYVAEGLGSCRVSIFLETGEFINTFTHQDMRQPYGIVIHRDNLYVTDTGVHAVFQFKIEAYLRLVAKLGSKGSGMGQFNIPRGLTVSANGDVFVADFSNHRIQILDDSLHFQRFITHQTMKHPCDVKLTPDEVYVLCEDSPCILVFSHAGEKIRSLITRGTGMQIGLAFFFCLDKKQNLLISDYRNNQVRIFSKEGTHLHTIGELGHEVGMFDTPLGIVLTKNMKLIIVSVNENYRLQIYSC